MFGKQDEVDPVRRLIGTAMGWGGNPEKEASTSTSRRTGNDGKTVYRLTVKDVPVDGFWSISVYNAEGYFEPNKDNAYSLNNITAKKEADGSVVVQFGGCEGNVAELPAITSGWNYLVRLYRPRQEILNGTWTFPSCNRRREDGQQDDMKHAMAKNRWRLDHHRNGRPTHVRERRGTSRWAGRERY